MELLFLAHRAPFPPDRGDKIRSYHVLRHLMARTRVHLVAFAEGDADFDVPAPLAEGLESITLIRRTKPQALAAVEALATGRPVSLTAFNAAAMRRAVAVRRVVLHRYQLRDLRRRQRQRGRRERHAYACARPSHDLFIWNCNRSFLVFMKTSSTSDLLVASSK